jgi:hypothetical protein
MQFASGTPVRAANAVGDRIFTVSRIWTNGAEQADPEQRRVTLVEVRIT